MTNGFRNRRWLIRLVLAFWAVSSLFAAFLLYQLNGIVHGSLYNYGLLFSNDWAVQYWSLERLLYACLYLPSSLGVFVLVFDLWRSRMGEVPIVKQVQSSAVTGKVSPIPVSPSPQTTARENDRDRPIDRNSMMISCPKCKRIFSKPLNMLDFSSGKAQLINVCPYCNYVLGDARHSDSEVRVFEPDDEEKEEVHERR